MRKWAVRDVRRIAQHALLNGAVPVNPTRIAWDVSGDCLNSRYVEMWGRQEQRPKKLVPANMAEFSKILRDAPLYAGSLAIEMETRCRKCRNCLKARAANWTFRAKYELHAAARTWFGTLTLGPQEHSLMAMRARSRLSAGGTDFDRLSAEEQFQERHREIGRELTLWLKRIRKESEAPLRYLLVVEAHKSGLPHYHVLVHEVDPARPVRERTLRTQWLLGFSKFNLVAADQPAAWYVCKYLSKAALARVRASVDYGKPPNGIGRLSVNKRMKF